MNAIVLSKRMDLGFSVQLAKTLGKNNSVIIFVKWTTCQFGILFFTSNTNCWEQYQPTHLHHLSLFSKLLASSCQKSLTSYRGLRHKLSFNLCSIKFSEIEHLKAVMFVLKEAIDFVICSLNINWKWFLESNQRLKVGHLLNLSLKTFVTNHVWFLKSK